MKRNIDRRKFVTRASLLAASATLPFAGYTRVKDTLFHPSGTNYKMGLQLFTIRDAMEKNARKSLKKVAALGYQDLETYGYNLDTKSYYGYPAKEFKSILDDLGLTATSGHYSFSDYFTSTPEALTRFVDQCIEGAKALDKSYITWPWLAPKYRNLEGFKSLSEKLNRIGEQVTATGLGFAYHNHDFEFIDYGGETGFDIIVRDTDSALVKLQMDLYWVMHSSPKSPKQLVSEQPGRYVMWHIKDMDKVTRDYTELGKGSIDYTKILPDPKLSGLEYYYLEQGGNFAENSMQSISDSASFFKEHLQDLL